MKKSGLLSLSVNILPGDFFGINWKYITICLIIQSETAFLQQERGEAMEHDIRVERTKTALRVAFVELLEEYSAYGISVTNLTKRAKISRVTFYIHYDDMSDFIEKICDYVVMDVKWAPTQDLNLFKLDNAKLIFTKQVETVRENTQLFRALLGDNGPDHFWDKFMEMIAYEYVKQITKHHKDKFENEGDMMALIKYISAGEMQLVTDWIRTDPIEPISTIVDRIMTFTFKGVFDSLGMMED